MPRVAKPVAAPAKRAGGKPRSDQEAAASAEPKAPTKRASARTPRPAEPAPAAPSAAAPPKRPASRRRPEAEVAEPAVTVVDKFLEEQRALLVSERATYAQQAETLRAEAEQLAAEMEPGDVQFDEESGEGGTMNVERERDLALSAQARAAVDEIDRALAKLDAGTYGICERCGEPIKRARLKALPYAALCIACKSGGLSRR